MSLNYDLTKTGLPHTEDGQVEWHDATEIIIWHTLVAESGPELNYSNVEEFYHRMIVYYRVVGRPEHPSYTLDELKLHIGLRTNVFPRKTDVQWFRKLRYIALQDRKTEIERHSEWIEQERIDAAKES